MNKIAILFLVASLASCNVSSETGDGGALKDTGAIADGGSSGDGATPDASVVDCNARRGEIMGDAEKAREAFTGCSSDNECTLIPVATKCVTSCPVAVNTAGTAEFKAAVEKISNERCTGEMIKACGFAAGHCEQKVATCISGVCSAANEPLYDAGSRDTGTNDSDACLADGGTPFQNAGCLMNDAGTDPDAGVHPPADDKEEYVLWTMALRKQHPSSTLVVVRDHTDYRGGATREQVLQYFPDVQTATLDDFLAKNATGGKFSLLCEFGFGVPLEFITDAGYMALGQGREPAWDKFRAAHPGAYGIDEAGRAGFNGTRDEAIFSYGNQNDFLSGAGYLVLARKVCGEWQIIRQVVSWVS